MVETKIFQTSSAEGFFRYISEVQYIYKMSTVDQCAISCGPRGCNKGLRLNDKCTCGGHLSIALQGDVVSENKPDYSTSPG